MKLIAALAVLLAIGGCGHKPPPRTMIVLEAGDTLVVRGSPGMENQNLRVYVGDTQTFGAPWRSVRYYRLLPPAPPREEQ